MATSESRTLSILARLVDGVSKPAGIIGRTLGEIGRTNARVFQQAGKVLFSLKGAVVSLAGAYIGLQAVAKVRAIGESADELLKLAEATGDSVENLSELQGAFELGGVKSEAFKDVLKQLGVATKAAFKDNDQVVRGFRQLGISIADLTALGPSQLFERLSVGLERFGTQQEKALALSKILPESYLRLLPTLAKGSQAFQDTVRQAREAGATVTATEAKSAEALNDAITRIEFSLGKTGRAIIQAFGPTAILILDKLTKAVGDNREQFVKILQAIGRGFVEATSLAVDAVVGLIGLIESIPGVDLLPEKSLKRLAEVRHELEQLNDFGPQRSFFRGESPADQAKLRAALEEEQKTLEGGLTRSITMARDHLRAELEASVAEIARSIEGAPAKTPEQTAQAFGVPGPDAVAAMGASIRAAFDKADPAVIAREFQSVFAATRGPGAEIGVEAATFDDLAKGARGLITELARITPGLEGVRDKLAEIERKEDVLALEEAAKNGLISAAELTAALGAVERKFDDIKRKAEAAQNTFAGGFKRSIEGLRDAATNLGESAGNALGTVLVNGVDGLGDAIGDVIAGTKSAKEAFSDFARQFLTEVARMVGKLLALGAIKTIFGLEDGGVVPGGVSTNVIPFRALARGDVIHSPTLAAIGEGKNSEAVVPLPDNRSIPVTFTGGGNGGTVYQFNITAMDGKDVRRVLVEQQTTLRAIWENQAEHKVGMRQIIQRSA